MPTLPGTVRAASPQARGFDASDPLDAGALADAVARRFTFCLRYLPFLDNTRPGDLDAAEAASIIAAGLALMPIYAYPGDGWNPTGALGNQYGERAVDGAQRIGFPAGINVWLDLEGVGGNTSSADVIAYCNAWSSVVAAAGYVPGLYVGANAGLTGQQLYYDLTLAHYWQSGSAVPAVPVRGYQMIQTIPDQPQSVGSVQIDLDSTQTDHSGGNAQWLAPG